MKISLEDVAAILREKDHILILSHQYPDGDTLGSAGALCQILQKMGKSARMECSDPIPDKYGYMLSGVAHKDFTPELVVAVDVADEKLLGAKLGAQWGGNIDLCIDHHGSNQRYARQFYVDPSASATAEIIFELAALLGVACDCSIASCIYTGITTDTGCFRYSNTTAATHRIAARLMETGVNAADINRLMFETKSRSRIELERMVLDTLEYYYNDRCAIISITQNMMAKAGADDSDLEGLAPIPRKIEGVLVGITLREKEDGSYKASVRTGPSINASAICARLGGGGHPQASGCSIAAGLEETKKRLLEVVAGFLGEAQ